MTLMNGGGLGLLFYAVNLDRSAISCLKGWGHFSMQCTFDPYAKYVMKEGVTFPRYRILTPLFCFKGWGHLTMVQNFDLTSALLYVLHKLLCRLGDVMVLFVSLSLLVFK